ncbi:MAG: DUF4271 domain-containing protein [Candidatus Symbiothrix sp.]|jgi:hypothetical protein|nr:DUF4271 domain-containing protein [Candidatus Symbiothrix sp.]
MQEQLLSEWPVAQNWGFVLFLLCFFISMQVLGSGRRLFAAMMEGLFRERNRQSIFFENIQHEFISKLLLTSQTIVLLSIFIFCIVSYHANVPLESVSELFWLIGVSSAVIIVFLLVKFAFNYMIGTVFFEKDQVDLFSQNMLSIVALSGLVLFIPTVLMFYVKASYYFGFYFNFIFLSLVEILICYKVYTIFFQKNNLLLYFILYLCTLEAVPLYLGYRALIYLLQNSTLWV